MLWGPSLRLDYSHPRVSAHPLPSAFPAGFGFSAAPDAWTIRFLLKFSAAATEGKRFSLIRNVPPPPRPSPKYRKTPGGSVILRGRRFGPRSGVKEGIVLPELGLENTLWRGDPNKHMLGAWWKACVVSGV